MPTTSGLRKKVIANCITVLDIKMYCDNLLTWNKNK